MRMTLEGDRLISDQAIAVLEELFDSFQEIPRQALREHGPYLEEYKSWQSSAETAIRTISEAFSLHGYLEMFKAAGNVPSLPEDSSSPTAPNYLPTCRAQRNVIRDLIHEIEQFRGRGARVEKPVRRTARTPSRISSEAGSEKCFESVLERAKEHSLSEEEFEKLRQALDGFHTELKKGKGEATWSAISQAVSELLRFNELGMLAVQIALHNWPWLAGGI